MSGTSPCACTSISDGRPAASVRRSRAPDARPPDPRPWTHPHGLPPCARFPSPPRSCSASSSACALGFARPRRRPRAGSPARSTPSAASSSSCSSWPCRRWSSPRSWSAWSTCATSPTPPGWPLKTLLWFGITALIAVAIGIGLGLLTNPGRGVNLDAGGAAAPKTTGSWIDFLTGIVPTNPVGAFVEGNVLQIVFLAVVVGAAALLVGERRRAVRRRSTASLLEIVQKALWWVIRLAPIGTLGLIGNAVAAYGWDLLAPLGEVHHRRLRRLRARAVRGLPAAARRWPAGSTRCASSPAPGPRSSWPSSPAPRWAPCR